MADTFTSKLLLPQFDPLLNYDVNKFSSAFLKIDNAFGTVICTSTTRPSTGLFDGLTLWETDTRRFVVRVSGAWVVAPVPAIIADNTARAAITTPYDGMMIYRQDRDWVEAYNGAAWRVVGVAHCTSVADRDGSSGITSPYTGQLCITTDTSSVWQWNGSAWISAVNRLIALSERTTSSSGSTGSTVGVRRVDNIPVRAGCTYRISTGTLHPTSTVSTDNMRVEIRYNTAGVATTASTVLPGALAFEIFGNTTKLEAFYTPGATQTLSLALCIARDTGSGTVSMFADGTLRRTTIFVEELPLVANSGTDL